MIGLHLPDRSQPGPKTTEEIYRRRTESLAGGRSSDKKFHSASRDAGLDWRASRVIMFGHVIRHHGPQDGVASRAIFSRRHGWRRICDLSWHSGLMSGFGRTHITPHLSPSDGLAPTPHTAGAIEPLPQRVRGGCAGVIVTDCYSNCYDLISNVWVSRSGHLSAIPVAWIGLNNRGVFVPLLHDQTYQPLCFFIFFFTVL